MPIRACVPVRQFCGSSSHPIVADSTSGKYNKKNQLKLLIYLTFVVVCLILYKQCERLECAALADETDALVRLNGEEWLRRMLVSMLTTLLAAEAMTVAVAVVCSAANSAVHRMQNC